MTGCLSFFMGSSLIYLILLILTVWHKVTSQQRFQEMSRENNFLESWTFIYIFSARTHILGNASAHLCFRLPLLVICARRLPQQRKNLQKRNMRIKTLPSCGWIKYRIGWKKATNAQSNRFCISEQVEGQRQGWWMRARPFWSYNFTPLHKELAPWRSCVFNWWPEAMWWWRRSAGGQSVRVRVEARPPRGWKK